MNRAPRVTPKLGGNLMKWLLIGGAIMFLLLIFLPRSSGVPELEISRVIQMAQDGLVTEIEVRGDRLNVTTASGDTFRSRKESSVSVLELLDERGTGTGAVTVSIGAHTIRGMAWSGEGAISGVEVSVDNGATWRPAKVKQSKSSYAWQIWEFVWEATRPGHFLIRARATDMSGRVQPDKADWNFRGFANNSIHAVPVSVK